MPPPSPIIHVVTDSWLAEDYEPGLVSVIVPTYNRERWIGSALDSLAEQTWPQIEIIVVDDGSTDDTAKLLAARSREQTGPRLQVMRQANAGVSAARNTGTQASRGEFIVYLDSDDLLFPRAIQNYVESLISNNAAYCFAPIDCVDAMGRLTSEPHYFYPKVEAPDFQLDCFWSVHGACYRRRVLCDAGAWNTQLRCGEDHELMWRIKSTAGLGYYLNEVQGVYRLHSGDQLHHEIDYTPFYIHKIEAMSVYQERLDQQGSLDRAICLDFAKRFRFFAFRLALQSRIPEKNQALKAMQALGLRARSPICLLGFLRLINGTWFYSLMSKIRYRRYIRIKRNPARG